ncbi:MAG: alkaline phosphatase family protein [Bacteroidota bacterium]|nr:alkaline phosphatase family protein [Bacteroidota bacterium]
MKYFILLSCIAITGLLASCNQGSKKVETRNGLKVPDHVVIVIEENHGYDQLIGNATAPYINALAAEAAVFTDSHGVTHPSQPNYLAFYSGTTMGIPGDQCLKDTTTPFTTPNLGAALLKNKYTFKGFAQTMPSTGFLDCGYLKSDLTDGTLYARKHAPWVNWLGNKENNIPDSLSLPMTAFPKDFGQLPTVAFAIPDQDHDMHNIGKPGDSAAISRGDIWLKENLGAYVEWAKTHNSLLILTYDEDQFTPQNHILTLFAGANVEPGKYSEKINHYSVLNTLEAIYGLHVTDSTNAFVIRDVWKK